MRALLIGLLCAVASGQKKAGGKRKIPFKQAIARSSGLKPGKRTIKVQGDEFTVFSQRMDWLSAAKKCRQEGLELAQVDTLFDAARIFSTAGSATWIGLKTISGKDGVWRWRSSEKSLRSSTPWGMNQPNDDGDILCGYIATAKGTLADANCNFRYAVACAPRRTFAKETKKEKKEEKPFAESLSPKFNGIASGNRFPAEFSGPSAKFSQILDVDIPVATQEPEPAPEKKYRHIDLSGANRGKAGRMPDHIALAKRAQKQREVFVNYDTDGNLHTEFTDSLDPEIEYIEADGVLMFHLDFEQNPEHHCCEAVDADGKCTSTDTFGDSMWPRDLEGRPMFLNSCQDPETFTPDIYPDTTEIEYTPECHGTPGDCGDISVDSCCNVHRGLNWTQSVCKCREYGGDIASPYDFEQDQYMFDFIHQIYADRFNFSNPKFCSDGNPDRTNPNCPFEEEGLTKLNWGSMIIWIGYTFNEDQNVWEMVDGTNLDFDYHYFGLKGSEGEGRKRRALDDVNVQDDNGEKVMQITIDNSGIPTAIEDIVLTYDSQKSPVCIGLLFDVDPDDQTEKLQWREQDCDRAQNVMCEVDFRETGVCRFGNVDDSNPLKDELTKITTDPFGIDPDRCVNWQKCEEGEMVTGTCAFDERFDKVLRSCMPAIAVGPCNVNECANGTHVCNGLNMHCEDTIGTYACICNEGYRWQDGKDTPTAENPNGRTPTPDNNYWVYDVGSAGTGDTNPQVGNGNHDASAGDFCVDFDECANGQTCPANATCSNLDIIATGRTHECLCDNGYHAVYNLSSEAQDLQGTTYWQLLTCEDDDECNGGKNGCSGPLQCVNVDGSYFCGCNPGYTTDAECDACIAAGLDFGNADPTQCDAESDGDCCNNIDECDDVDLNLCPTDSVCQDGDGSYFCECNDPEQYIEEVVDAGTGRWTCVDRDECSEPAWNGCDINSACINLDPSYYCPCNPGWDNCADLNKEIEGTCCEDRDECALDAPCALYADCTNNIGLQTVIDIIGIERLIGYSCSCAQGYVGEGYDQCLNFDECTNGTHLCDDNSQCIDTNGDYLCLCDLGYSKNGLFGETNEFYTGLPVPTDTCDDLDECQPDKNYHACDENAVCSNTAGSYECDCEDGYEGDGYKCLDIQECLDPVSNECDVGIIRPLIHEGTANCINIEGGYTCECEEGFTGDGFNTGTGCDDDDECANTPCHANGICSNTVGSYLCTCQEGYEMVVGNEPECINIDECSIPGTCHEDATCADNDGSYVCTCIDGYTGDGAFCADINECTDDTDECADEATCTNTDASYTCACPDGYISGGTPDGQTCTEIDECTVPSHNCDTNAICDNLPLGSFTCTCNEGYTGTGVTGDCNDVNECATGTHDCDVLADCTDNVGSYDCLCFDGYESVNTPEGRTGDCSNIDECALDTDDCDANALCLNLLPPDKFDCNCVTGYEGDGQTCTLIDECVDGTHNCDTNAQCTKNQLRIDTLGFTCACNAGWTDRTDADGFTLAAGLPGLSCIDIDECVESPPCSVNADCVNTPGSYSCGCEDGFTGPNADTCTDIDECSDPIFPCHADADCTNNDGSFTCACKDGYFGTGLLCEDLDECRALPDTGCDENAVCVNDIGTFHCECFAGYSSPLGVATVGDCVPRNECVEQPELCPAAVDGGICVDLPPNQNGYRCECAEGYEYVEDFNFCQDLDECLFFPCTDGAQCTNLEPGYSCACMAGYTQQNGTLAPDGDGFCTEYDECLLGPHNCNLTTSICVNTFGSHICICKPGYILDATGACVDVDECLTGGCPAESTGCTNMEGGFDCSCPDGFEGTMTLTPIALDTVNGEVITGEAQVFECGDRDECVVQIGFGCPENSACTNIQGGLFPSCLCAEGFTDANNGANSTAPNCVDVDECVNSPCNFGASCANSAGSFVCNCPDGYEGDGITNCDDIDECDPTVMSINFGRRRRQATNDTAAAGVNNCDPTAICINQDGSYFCVCPTGTLEDPVTHACEDIDECVDGGHGCEEGEECLNFVGGNICFLIPVTTKAPVVEGDPHVRVSYGEEPSVCFDLSDDDRSILSLVADLETGLEVNGQVFTESIKKEKSRLETVGFRSPRGIEVGVYVDQVTVGIGGIVHERYTYSDSVSHGLDDVHILVHPLEKGTPKRGVTVSVGSDAELRFNVFIKSHKDSMIFEIERGTGLSDNLSGVLGQTMRGGTPYHVDEDGIIHVNDRIIDQDNNEWSAVHNCKQIKREATEVFLGHPIREYRVKDLFSPLKATWLDAILEAIGLPKRRR